MHPVCVEWNLALEKPRAGVADRRINLLYGGNRGTNVSD